MGVLKGVALQIILLRILMHCRKQASAPPRPSLSAETLATRHVFEQKDTFLAIKLRYTTESSFPSQEVGRCGCSESLHSQTTQPTPTLKRRGWGNRSPRNFLESRQQLFSLAWENKYWRVASFAVESGQVYTRGVLKLDRTSVPTLPWPG
jgi:hypothetical protein